VVQHQHRALLGGRRQLAPQPLQLSGPGFAIHRAGHGAIQSNHAQAAHAADGVDRLVRRISIEHHLAKRRASIVVAHRHDHWYARPFAPRIEHRPQPSITRNVAVVRQVARNDQRVGSDAAGIETG
jgi:hypothetical protein